MKHNVRVFAKHISTDDNNLADALSRYQMNRFWKDIAKEHRDVNESAEDIPQLLHPVDKLWIN